MVFQAPSSYAATSRLSKKECGSATSYVTTDVPGVLPLSGETRSRSVHVVLDAQYDWSDQYSNGTRIQHAEETAGVSVKYVDDDGRLSVTGTVTCAGQYSSTGAPSWQQQDYALNNGAHLLHHIQTNGHMPMKVLISGNPATEDYTFARSIRIQDRNAAEYFTTGTPFYKTLLSGVAYEIELRDNCGLEGASYDYSIVIEA